MTNTTHLRKGINPLLPDAAVRVPFTDEGVVCLAENWRDGEREAEAWRDGDTQTYRYRANLLDALIVRLRKSNEANCHLRAVVATVRSLHTPVRSDRLNLDLCIRCRETFPCRTITALNTEEN